MATNKDPLTILVTSLSGFNYLVSSLRVAMTLNSRGNDVYFANQEKHRAGVERLGLKFIAFEDVDPDYCKNTDLVVSPYLVTKSMSKVNMPPVERLNHWTEHDAEIILVLLREVAIIDSLLRKIMINLKPDIIIAETIYPLAISMQDEIPTIPIYSGNPIGLYYKSGLLHGTGFSVTNPDKKLWDLYRAKEKLINEQIVKEFNRWYNSFGLYVNAIHSHSTFARFFGIYVYPEALDYFHDLCPTPLNWVRLDPFVRKPAHPKFTLPEPLASKPGKIIYIAIDTLTGVHEAITNRLISIFARTKYRFIVCRGIHLKLPGNMCGKNLIDEMTFLPDVDMIIGQGHNQTIIESLYYAKPMIVIPLYFNQLDNAQRLQDLKLGYRIDPFNYGKAEIHSMVEKLLTDVDLHERIRKVSEQLKNSNNHDRIAEMIENTARAESARLKNQNSFNGLMMGCCRFN